MTTAVMDAPTVGADVSSDLPVQGSGNPLDEVFQDALNDIPDDDPGPSQIDSPVAEEEPAEEVPEESEETPAEQDGPYKLTADGAYAVPKQDMDVLNGFREYAEKVQDLFPTAEDAEGARIDATSFRGMRTDWLNAEDAKSLEGVLKHLAGGDEEDPTVREQFAQSFVKMVSHLPNFLPKVNKEAFATLRDSMLDAAVEEAYQKAIRTGNPDDIHAAQNFDYWRSDKRQYKTELPKYDPAEEARKAFEDREATLKQNEEVALGRDWDHFEKNAIKTQRFGPMWQSIDAELAPLQGKFTDQHIQSLRLDIQKAVFNKIMEDREWEREQSIEYNAIKRAYEQNWKNGQSANGLMPRIQRSSNDFLAKFRKYLPSIAKTTISQRQLVPMTASRGAARPQTSTPSRPAGAANGAAKPAQQRATPQPGKSGFDWGTTFAPKGR